MTHEINLSNVSTICFDCAMALGFTLKDKAIGVWTDTCDVCKRSKPCTNLHHDWVSPKKRRNEMTVLSQDKIDALAKMSVSLSPAEVVRTASFEVITAILHDVSSDFKSSSTPNMRNIRLVDCDQVANLLDAVAERIEQLLAVISVHKEETK